MKVVLDSSVLVKAFEREGAIAQRLIETLLDLDHEIVVSNSILGETSRVLRYDRIRRRHGKSDLAIYEFLLLLQSVALCVNPNMALAPPIRDPNDIIVIQTAVAAGADLICTVDKDFTQPPARAYLEALGIRVMTDLELADTLRIRLPR